MGKKHLRQSENRIGKFVMQENKCKPPLQRTSTVGDSKCQRRQDFSKTFYEVWTGFLETQGGKEMSKGAKE